jgi:hypothetical protein
MAYSINSQQISVKISDSSRNYYNKSNPNINKQTVSIIGNSLLGLPFIPSFSNEFLFSENGINDFNNFSTTNGTFIDNLKKYDNNILPYISSYAVLQNQGQLNFTKILGLDLSKDKNTNKYQGLNPGFEIKNNQKIYCFYLNLSKKDSSLLNNINYNILNDEANQNIFIGYIVTDSNVSLNVSKISDNEFLLKIIGANYLINNNSSKSQKHLQDYVFNNITNDSAFNEVNFSFNKTSQEDIFWKDVLNLNYKRLKDFGYCFINYVDGLNNLFDSFNINSCNLLDLTNVSLKNFQEEYKYAETPWIVSQGFYGANDNHDRTDLSLRVNKLFKIHAINPGSFSNNLAIKIIPRSLGDEENFASFDLFLINKKNEEIIWGVNNLNLDKSSENYICRVIGSQKIFFDLNTKNVCVEGEYINQNPWIRIEISDYIESNNFKKYSIPAGFLGYKRKIQHTDQEGKIIYNLNNYSKIIQLDQFNFKKLSKKHAWGKNFKNIKSINNNENIFESFQSIINPYQDQINYTYKSTIKNKISQLNYISYNYNDLIQERNIELDEYLNKNYYQEDDNDDFKNEDMFHLEKIILLNEKIKNINNYIQRWDLAKYIQSGENINVLLNENFEWNHLFENKNDVEKILYYFTITNKNTVYKNSKSIDSVEETAKFDDETSVLSFVLDLNGGFDGLNIFDIDEYCINDKGLEKSQYLRELYKIAIDCIINKSNGQNEIIYLPEIYNKEVIEYLVNQNFARNSLLIIDKPLYNINNSIIYCNQLTELDKSSEPKFNWSLKKYKYKYIGDIDITSDDNIDINKTILNLTNDYTFSNISTFFNYSLIEILGISRLTNDNITRQFFIPSGLIAIYILMNYDNISNNKMNPISNILLNNIGDFQIKLNYLNILNHDHPRLLENQKLFNNLKVNMIYKDIINGINTFTFFSNKTNEFERNSDVLSRLNISNVLLDIKKKIEFLSLNFIFEQIKSQDDVLKKLNSLYSLLLTQYKVKGEILDFKIKLDSESTSIEDLINNLIKGAIYLKFPGQKNIEIVKIDI